MPATYNISRANAIAILVELKFKSAPNWANERLTTKCEGLLEYIDGNETLSTPELQKEFNALYKALGDKATVSVVDEVLPGANKATKPAKADAAPKGEKETPPAKAPAAGKKPAKANEAAEDDAPPAATKPAKADAAKGADKKPATKPAKAPAAPKGERAPRAGTQCATLDEIVYGAKGKYVSFDEIYSTAKKTHKDLTEVRTRAHLTHHVKAGLFEANKEKGWRAVKKA